MNRLVLVAFLGSTSAFTPPASMQQLTRASVSPSADVAMMAAKKGGFNLFGNGPASPTKPKVTPKAKPLSPGSNYPATKNIQSQKSGFGNFVQKFQLASGKSKYGMPIFLPNGAVNPAYLAAERKEMQAASKKNTGTAEAKRKKLISKKEFELADYVRKKIGNVGSGQDYYQSGR